MGEGSGFQRPRTDYIEYLEKRIAPATFIVTNLDDAGAGSLRQAVLNANANPGLDNIVFRGAATNGEITLAGVEIDITDSVNIKGPGAGRLIIDAQDLSRIFNIDDDTDIVKRVTISGLSMVEGNSATDTGTPGGGIRTTESLTLLNSVVSGCRAPGGPGGGIYAYTTGRVVITNSKITGNYAGNAGGGLWLQADSGVQVTNSLISGNTATFGGGGVYANINSTGTGDILLQNVKITNNNSTGSSGGGAFLDNDRENASGAKVGKITVRNSLVTGNIANLAGGGIYLSDGNGLIDRSTISNNSATFHGGGINDDAMTSLTILNSRVTDNFVTSDDLITGGGGIYIFNDRNVTIQRTTIAGNNSSLNGGGILASQSTIAILASTISENFSIGAGGGVATTGLVTERTDIRVVGSLFAGNRAADAGGGMDTRGDGNVTISNSRFLNNNAGEDGGGLYLRSESGRITVTNSLISENTARDDGGGLALRSAVGGSASITNTTITNNVAAGDDGGGVAIFTTSDSVRFSTSRVTGNVAAEQGGGIFTAGALIVLDRTIVVDNTAPIDPQFVTPS